MSHRADFPGIADGWHYVTVTDLNGCMVNDSIEVTVPNPIALVISGTNVSCNGGSDGYITVSSPVGGTGSGYEVSIDNATFYTTFPKSFFKVH